MNYQNNKKMIIGVIVLGLILLGSCLWYFYRSEKSTVAQSDNSDVNTVVGNINKNNNENNQAATKTLANIIANEPATSLVYKNTEYGFNFTLPLSWKGYSIINDNWEGQMVNGQNNKSIKGPKIIIRNPLWTKEAPSQDIPVMVFTPDQWNLIQKEELAVSAAPIGPSELGQNVNYIFALPARYNYAYPVGFEEVQTIIDSKPLQGF